LAIHEHGIPMLRRGNFDRRSAACYNHAFEAELFQQQLYYALVYPVVFTTRIGPDSVGLAVAKGERVRR
jgi:hypothetical protein